jgi:hypothetical protein
MKNFKASRRRQYAAVHVTQNVPVCMYMMSIPAKFNISKSQRSIRHRHQTETSSNFSNRCHVALFHFTKKIVTQMKSRALERSITVRYIGDL